MSFVGIREDLGILVVETNKSRDEERVVRRDVPHARLEVYIYSCKPIST